MDKMLETDIEFMKLALAEAEQAALEEETPIGAVVVKDGKVLVAAHNKREAWHDIAAHAELIAMREAEKMLGDWRLSDCTVYITLEPVACLARFARGIRRQGPRSGCLWHSPESSALSLGECTRCHRRRDGNGMSHPFAGVFPCPSQIKAGHCYA